MRIGLWAILIGLTGLLGCGSTGESVRTELPYQGPTAEPMYDSRNSEAIVRHAVDLMLKGKNEEALKALHDIKPITDDHLASLLAATLLSRLDDPDKALEYLEYVRREWRGSQPLTLDRVVLCRQVNSYRDYESFPVSHRFAPGDDIIIYTELSHFHLEKAGYEKYRVHLKLEVELVNAAGRLQQTGWDEYPNEYARVLRGEVEAVTLPVRVWLPPNLRDGRYRIRVRAKDILGAAADGPPVEDGARRLAREDDEEILINVQIN
jgi:hypothetical protein